MFHLQGNFFFLPFHFSMMIPGNAAGVAKQFLRCVFHQLAPNGIFPQLFQSNIKGEVRRLSAFLISSNIPVFTLNTKMVFQFQMEVFYGPWPHLLWTSVS